MQAVITWFTVIRFLAGEVQTAKACNPLLLLLPVVLRDTSVEYVLRNCSPSHVQVHATEKKCGRDHTGPFTLVLRAVHLWPSMNGAAVTLYILQEERSGVRPIQALQRSNTQPPSRPQMAIKSTVPSQRSVEIFKTSRSLELKDITTHFLLLSFLTLISKEIFR